LKGPSSRDYSEKVSSQRKAFNRVGWEIRVGLIFPTGMLGTKIFPLGKRRDWIGFLTGFIPGINGVGFFQKTLENWGITSQISKPFLGRVNGD